MKIGIDIDDTMTKIKDRIANARGVIYVPHFNKEVDKLDQLIIDIKNKYLRSEKDE